ncbi:MAG: ABC transporter ATP-binding protein [Nocardioides sp.]|nr:ABC transporter ATP-binding protein [Nocardioides sp.]
MLEISSLVKSYAGERARRGGSQGARVFAVNDVNLHVEKGEMFTLLGPSGCGKTTTLRSIAGLEKPDSGRIGVKGRTLFAAGGGRKAVNVAANRRGLGMVFQSYAIWPHMTVFDNVAFPLQVKPRVERPDKAGIRQRVDRVLDVMELRQYAGRPATKLSGGQQQRLALARALVIEPELLLLDEPLSNLDAKLRESLRYELKRLQRELGITSIYVTHDQIEALSLSSHIAVMRDGQVMQLGKPRDIYENPTSKFVAEFIGSSNFVPGHIAARDGDVYTVDTAAGRLALSSSADMAIGTEVSAAVRPESLELSTARPADFKNVWEGVVGTRAFLGDAVDHLVQIGALELRVRSLPNLSLEAGTQVFVKLPADKLSLVPIG